MEAKTLKVTNKHTCRVKPQGLPTLMEKRNDEKPMKQLK
jgi:hypothetical protein